MNDYIIYKEWPEETIRDAIYTFRDTMRDGAGPKELQAGLHGLDFLIRASTIPDDLSEYLDAITFEAEWRIELMLEKENEDKTREQIRQNAIRTIKSLQYSIKRIQNIIDSVKNSDPDEIMEILQKRRNWSNHE